MSNTLVGLLTTRSHPLLPYFLDRLESQQGIDPVLIFDQKDFSTKDKQIFEERTRSGFPPRSVAPWLTRYRWTTVQNHNGQECQTFVKAHNIRLLVNAGTPRIIKRELIESVSIGVLNVHPGLLPKYRGASCCEWAIYNDDPVGVSAHFMDAGVDSGPIISTQELVIRKGQTYTEVRVALYHLAHEVRCTAIQAVLQQDLRPASLPPQLEAPVFKPIPDKLLEVVKRKLANGEYRHNPGSEE